MATKQHEFSSAEKQMMVTSYHFFNLQKKQGLFSGKRTRELVAECIGCSPETVARVVAHYRAREDAAFESTPNNRGRPHSYDLDLIAPTVRSFVVAQNKAGRPITAQSICDEVAGVTGVCLGVPTMTRALHDLGLHHLKGDKRHIYAESIGNIAFRRSYLEKKIGNRRPIRGPMRGSERTVRHGVDRPEVYLDESYCNVNHVTGKTWLTADKIRYGKTGRGARVCIIAAGIIKSKGAVMTGGFVEGSIQVWNSTLKRKHGDDDYHGNFDAAQFERWFEQLCVTLSKFGGCNIYLDGASYHKRELNPGPRKSGWRKADIQEWLRKNAGMVFSNKATVVTLIELVELYRPPKRYQVTKIATTYGHLVFFTPPYHPTLQPIELIWGTVKGRIARDPPKNANDAVEKVLNGLADCDDLWLKVYRHVQQNENAFYEADI